MTFGQLALICAAGILGPVLALSRRWAAPIVVGELIAGIALGPMGFHRLDAAEPTFTFLADVGFALVMFVAGSHVPVRDRRLSGALGLGLARAALVGVASVPVAVLIAWLAGTGHAALYAVLLSSSSAALILPIMQAQSLTGAAALELLPQVALADIACIVALPLAIDPARAGRTALGALGVLACAGVLYMVLRAADERGWRERVHDLSEHRKFALELRLNLAMLFALAAIAQASRVSIMLAGFSFGLAIAAIGEPRRLTRQLFAVGEGFLGPLFFVWLGASLDLKALAHQPALIGLGVALGLGAVLTHLTARLTGQPVLLGGLAAAQLGVPIAAATLGTQAHLLSDGEPAAMILGALVTIAVASIAAGAASRSDLAATKRQSP